MAIETVTWLVLSQISMVVGQAYQAHRNSKTAMANTARTLSEQRERQEDQHAFQAEQASEDRAVRLTLQKRDHHHRDAHLRLASEEQLKTKMHPLAVVQEWLEIGAPPNTLRCFIAPPRALNLPTMQGQPWGVDHAARLERHIQTFVARWFSTDSEARPVYVYGSDVLNPLGLRNNTAVAVMQRYLPDDAAIWLQTDRIGVGGCGLSLAYWNEDVPASFRPIGEIPNYALAQQSMAASMTLRGQTTADENPPDVPDALQNLHLGWRQERQDLEAEMRNPAGEPTLSAKDLSDPFITEAAVDYLAEACKMSLAAAADTHHLMKGGQSPILPHLIKQGVFDLEDRYVQAATGGILADYLQCSARLAAARPALAADIWLGMAEAAAPLQDAPSTTKLVLEAARHLAGRPTAPARLDDLPSLLSTAAPDPAQTARLKALLAALDQPAIIKAIEGPKESELPSKKKEPIGVADWQQNQGFTDF